MFSGRALQVNFSLQLFAVLKWNLKITIHNYNNRDNGIEKKHFFISIFVYSSFVPLLGTTSQSSLHYTNISKQNKNDKITVQGHPK